MQSGAATQAVVTARLIGLVKRDEIPPWPRRFKHSSLQNETLSPAFHSWCLDAKMVGVPLSFPFVLPLFLCPLPTPLVVQPKVWNRLHLILNTWQQLERGEKAREGGKKSFFLKKKERKKNRVDLSAH